MWRGRWWRRGSTSKQTPPTTTDLVIPTIPSSAPPIANIARARPRPGSVTQSSNVGGDGITLDQITFNRSGFIISNRNGFSFSNPDDGDDPNYSTIYDPDDYYITRKLYGTDEGINKKLVSYNFKNELQGLKGREAVHSLYRETDYLLLGYWTKNDRTSTEETYSDIGTFVTGGDLFNDNMPIEGKVTYQGISYVVSFEGNDISFIQSQEVHSQEVYGNDLSAALGDSSLSVDFGTGIISGTISNFSGVSVKANQTIITDGGLQDLSGELILSNAKIGSNNSGFFEGNLTGTLDGRTYNGLYGGQFYGNGESDGRPGTVAGTLGGVSSDGQFTITGYWMGDK